MPLDHLVILVHGINTRAFWMEAIRPTLEKAGFSVSLIGYGKFSPLGFLSYFSSQREKAITRVVREIRIAREEYKLENGHEPARTSVISHSFGTYVIGRILTDYPEFQWYRLIFCGSVVKDDFPFDEEVLQRFTPPLLNEAGTKDYWPALAESAGWDYGSVGSTGFNAPPVETRWHKGFAHSDFLNQEFCDKFWTPFLLGQAPQPADQGQDLPLWIRLIASLPIRYLFLPQLVWLILVAIVLLPTYLMLSPSQQNALACAVQHPLDRWTPKPRHLGSSIAEGTATVKGVKIVLNELHYYSGEIDYKPTPDYSAAVRQFEKDANITVDGYVGPDFIDALQSRSVPDLTKKLEACGP